MSQKYLTKMPRRLERGKVVFAERCARCHSSKLPPTARRPRPGERQRAELPAAWNAYWEWTKTETFKTPMRRKSARAPTSSRATILSSSCACRSRCSDQRVQSAGTNAIRDNIWDNFSSESYKTLPRPAR